MVQARRVPHPLTLSFDSSRFVWPACRLSDVTQQSEHDFASIRPHVHLMPSLDKKQRRHGELGSSQCLSCKRSNWNWPLYPATVETVSIWFFSPLLLQSHSGVLRPRLEREIGG